MNNTEVATLYKNIFMRSSSFEISNEEIANIIPLDSPNYVYYSYLNMVFSMRIYHKRYNDLMYRLMECRCIEERTFMDAQQITAFFAIYTKLLKTHNQFQKLAVMWKWKRTPTYNQEDFLMNHIEEGQKNTITILQNNRKYVFHLRDLIKHFHRELSNSPNFFVQPIPCKNPYTNIVFNKSSLYNIYFALKESTFIMPSLFHLYFLKDFNIHKFMNEHDSFIREESIEEYFKEVSTNLHGCVNAMFAEFNVSNCMDSRYPSDKLFDLMKPYLRLYFISKYSQNKWKKMDAFVRLYKKLHLINPGFGRFKYKKTEYILLHPGGNRKKDERHAKFIKSFNDELPRWQYETPQEYLNSHSVVLTNDSKLIIEYENILNHLQKYGRYSGHHAAAAAAAMAAAEAAAEAQRLRYSTHHDEEDDDEYFNSEDDSSMYDYSDDDDSMAGYNDSDNNSEYNSPTLAGPFHYHFSSATASAAAAATASLVSNETVQPPPHSQPAPSSIEEGEWIQEDEEEEQEEGEGEESEIERELDELNHQFMYFDIDAASQEE